MRILLVYYRFADGGGLEKYLAEFSRRLAGSGHTLEVVTLADARTPPAVPATIHRVSMVPGSKTLTMLRFSRAAEAMVRSLPHDLSIGFGRTVAHDLHPAGGGCHRLYSELLPWHKRFGMRNRVELKLERELYTSGKTRRFVVNSRQVQRQLEQVYGVVPDRFSVIHTAVDTERFSPESSGSTSSDLPARGSRPVFLFVSLSHRRKGLDAILDVWARTEADLWIVGSPLAAKYRRSIARQGLADRVRYLGPQRDLAPIYRRADFLLHPTLYDACANTVLQSMACGLPGIISARDGAIDFTTDGVTGLRLNDPQDRGELLLAIQSAMALAPAERAQLGQAARAAMLPLTWERHLAGWEKAIAALD